jgi:uncharacterized protein (DUF1697 family)
MPTWIALLRAVNVAGHAPVAMADLRALVTRLGFGDARTLLQSGNVVFRAGTRSGAALEGLLEAEAARRLSLRTECFVRTVAEWRAIVAHNPFRREAERDPGHLVVMVLKRAPQAAAVTALRAAIAGPEMVRGHGREAYITYPDGIGRSRLTAAVIEKALGTRGTGRNWNTVRKLEAAASGT